MKLMIDIPDKDYDNKTLVDYFGCYSKMLDATIYNGTPIPDNATNGDVIKAMFPNDNTVKVMEVRMKSDWWNAPYQKGGKE